MNRNDKPCLGTKRVGTVVLLAVALVLSVPGPVEPPVPNMADDYKSSNASAKEISHTEVFEVLRRHSHHSNFSLKPLQLLDQYIKWHSVASLRRQPENRNFAIAHYACPLQAGNRIHHFLNDLILAILTNRTVLWKYWDRETCLRIGNSYDLNVCQTVEWNKVRDCDKVLERVFWLPSYNEWSSRLNLSKPVHVRFSPGKRRSQYRAGGSWVPWDDKATGRSGPSPDWQVVEFQPLVGAQKSKLADRLFFGNAWAGEAAELLFSLGRPFAYGFLFHSSFSVTRAVDAIQPSRPMDPLAPAVALHSRHADPGNDGSDVTLEIECLQNVLPEVLTNGASQACQVYLMSDRPRTLDRLQIWLHINNCTAITAKHTPGRSFESEQ